MKRVNPDCTGSQEIKLNVPGVPPGTSGGVISSNTIEEL